MFIHVCPLAAIDETIRTSGAAHVMTLLGAGDMIEERRDIAAGQHLRILVNDIVEPGEGLVMAGEEHIRQIVDFARGWDRARPMVVHCWAGVSRSTAAAFIALCALNQDLTEMAVAAAFRAAAPFAKPNLRLVGLADDVLAREGRMVAAIEAQPEAEFIAMGRPFRLPAILEPVS